MQKQRRKVFIVSSADLCDSSGKSRAKFVRSLKKIEVILSNLKKVRRKVEENLRKILRKGKVTRKIFLSSFFNEFSGGKRFLQEYVLGRIKLKFMAMGRGVG